MFFGKWPPPPPLYLGHKKWLFAKNVGFLMPRTDYPRPHPTQRFLPHPLSPRCSGGSELSIRLVNPKTTSFFFFKKAKQLTSCSSGRCETARPREEIQSPVDLGCADISLQGIFRCRGFWFFLTFCLSFNKWQFVLYRSRCTLMPSLKKFWVPFRTFSCIKMCQCRGKRIWTNSY